MSVVNATLWIGGLKKRILDRDAIQESDSGALNMIWVEKSWHEYNNNSNNCLLGSAQNCLFLKILDYLNKSHVEVMT